MYGKLSDEVKLIAMKMAMTPDQAAKAIAEASPEEIQQALRQLQSRTAGMVSNVALALALLFGVANAADAAKTIIDVKKQESIPAAQVKAPKPGTRDRAEAKLKQMFLEQGVNVDSLFAPVAKA